MLQIVHWNGRRKLWSEDYIHICPTKFKLLTKNGITQHLCWTLSQYTRVIPKKGRRERKKKQREGVGEREKRRATNSNVGTNTGTFAKTLREPALTSNLNKAKELLRAQFWKSVCTLECETILWSATGVGDIIPVLQVLHAHWQNRNSRYSTQQPHLHQQQAILPWQFTDGYTKCSPLHIQGIIWD